MLGKLMKNLFIALLLMLPSALQAEVLVGSDNIATNQITIGTTATPIAPKRTGRHRVIITKQAATNCAFGNAGVTLSTGWIPDNSSSPSAGMSVTFDTQAAIYGVCASNTNSTLIELYNN